MPQQNTHQKYPATFAPDKHKAPQLYTQRASQDLYQALAGTGVQKWKDGTYTAYMTPKNAPNARVSLAVRTVNSLIVRTSNGSRYLMGRVYPSDKPGSEKQAASGWEIIKLPERDDTTGRFVKKPGEKVPYWAGPAHNAMDYPEAVMGQSIWGKPGGDTSTVESITISADEITSSFVYDYPQARDPSDPVMSRLQQGIETVSNNGRIDPFEAAAEYVAKVNVEAVGKLATYNAAIQ